jgi:hypothetical protein
MAVATAAARAQNRIDMGRTVQRTFESLGRRFLPYSGLALLLGAVPAFLSSYASMQVLPDMMTSMMWIGVLVSLLFGYVLQAALVRSMILDLSGRPVDVAGSLVAALQLLPQMLGLTILSSIAFLVGFVFLVVPGIIIYIMLSVSVPVLVEERLGVVDSMARSKALTEGSRWRIFWLLVLFGIFYVIVSVASGRATLATGAESLMLITALQAIASGVVALLGSAMAASLYIELRTVKEGATADGLAEIFE